MIPPEPPRRAWWLAKRVLLAAVGIVLLSGGATYAVARNEVGRVVEALRQNKTIKVASSVLAPTGKGEPETLLLVGNDERQHTTTAPVLPHSNEMLLVRLDPSKPTISMLSIPRELQVTFTVPNGEVITNRINSAYTYGFEDGGGASGGVKLMLETIKNVLGITVNHVFVTNFKKFERAVTKMGCVYMTVDKRYFHSNSEPGAEQYFEINLQPGYQRLCGKQALEFVANRHESTSLIRDARDQRFLLNVKSQYGPTLVENREKFEQILGKAVETTVHGEEEVLQLLELLIESSGKPVRQVPFHVNLGPSLDTATPQQLGEAAHSFLAGTAPIPKHTLNTEVHSAHEAHGAHAAHRAHPSAVAALSLAPTPSSTIAEARTYAPQLPFALEAPQYQKTNAEAAADELRAYRIQGPHGRRYPAYVIVVDEGELGQYYDIEGSNWADPPILSDPNETIRIGARTYSLFYDGEHLKTVAWREGGATYWIENTLTYNLSPETMVTIARYTRPVIGPTVPVRVASTRPHRVALPPTGVTTTSLTSKLAAALGFIGLAIVAFLSIFVLLRGRELIQLREQVAQALLLEARQRPLLTTTAGAAAIPIPAPDEPAPTIYRARKRWRRGILAAGAVVIVAALVVLAVHFLPAILG